MKKISLTIIVILSLSLSGCKDNDDSLNNNGLILNFTHNWDNDEINISDLNDLKYPTENNTLISISKLRYLISNISLQNEDEENVELEGYFLVDLNNNNTNYYISNVPIGNYTRISFTFGFIEEDNINGAYPDLNSTLWNWPEMLGGGYHFMQFEGRYDDNATESPFAYHMGTARISEGQFEQNFFNNSSGGLVFDSNSTIEIQMNVAEWFKNPNIWDLGAYNIDLMPNYDAQKMMNQNGQSVFNITIIAE